ncbi:MAG: response regulator transcription factor [Pseudomonadales bacterium]|nr:response regulator transcription factor [Pseudomonadales bacterium]
MASDGLVYVVDDDDDVRFGLRMLLESAGYHVREFGDATQFLRADREPRAACVILDINMPEKSGLELHRELTREGTGLPVIFLTGHGTVPTAVEALRRGAVDFFQKPIEDDEKLIARVEEALTIARQAIEHESARVRARGLLEALTPREREIVGQVRLGHANKVIAIDLGISERTVELHRGRAMKKLKVRSVPELIRLLEADSAAPE